MNWACTLIRQLLKGGSDYSCTDELVEQVINDYSKASLDQQDMRMLELAEKMPTSPSTMTKNDVEQLRKVGFSVKEILDIVHIAAPFNTSTGQQTLQVLNQNTGKVQGKSLISSLGQVAVNDTQSSTNYGLPGSQDLLRREAKQAIYKELTSEAEVEQAQED